MVKLSLIILGIAVLIVIAILFIYFKSSKEKEKYRLKNTYDKIYRDSIQKEADYQSGKI